MAGTHSPRAGEVNQLMDLPILQLSKSAKSPMQSELCDPRHTDRESIRSIQDCINELECLLQLPIQYHQALFPNPIQVLEQLQSTLCLHCPLPCIPIPRSLFTSPRNPALPGQQRDIKIPTPPYPPQTMNVPNGSTKSSIGPAASQALRANQNSSSHPSSARNSHTFHLGPCSPSPHNAHRNTICLTTGCINKSI
jgi:hypothetical protein